MDKILEHLPDHVMKSKAERVEESYCTGFCKLLEFNASAPIWERNPIITMVMAALGS